MLSFTSYILPTLITNTCMFVLWGFSSNSRFSLIWRHHHDRRNSKFDRYSPLMAREQRGLFSVPHLLWHGTSVYNGHLYGPVNTCFNDLALSERGSNAVFPPERRTLDSVPVWGIPFCRFPICRVHFAESQFAEKKRYFDSFGFDIVGKVIYFFF